MLWLFKRDLLNLLEGLGGLALLYLFLWVRMNWGRWFR